MFGRLSLGQDQSQSSLCVDSLLFQKVWRLDRKHVEEIKASRCVGLESNLEFSSEHLVEYRHVNVFVH